MKRISIVFLFLVFIFIPFISKADLTTDYNTQYYALQQQILNLQNEEKQAIQELANEGMPASVMMGRVSTITAQYDNQIQKIKSQEQQLYLNYQEAINNQQIQTQQQAQQPACGLNSYYSNGFCYCNTGYKPGSDGKNCYMILCPDNSTLNGSQCICNSGYRWNLGQTSCVQVPSKLITNDVATPQVINQQGVNQPTETKNNNNDTGATSNKIQEKSTSTVKNSHSSLLSEIINSFKKLLNKIFK